MNRFRTAGNCTYLGGYAPAPVPVYPVWRRGQVEITDTGLVYRRGFQGIGFYKTVLSFPLAEITGSRVETSRETTLQSLVAGPAGELYVLTNHGEAGFRFVREQQARHAHVVLSALL